MIDVEQKQTTQKLVCMEYRCRWVGLSTEALKAPDPFNEGDYLIACPKCREQTLHTCCDEPGCNLEASNGTPTEEGYRYTCHNHVPKK